MGTGGDLRRNNRNLRESGELMVGFELEIANLGPEAPDTGRK